MESARPRRRALWVAAVLAAGFIVGRAAPMLHPAWWLGAALVLALAAWAHRAARSPVIFAASLLLAGAGWWTLRVESTPAASLARELTEQPGLLAIEGTVRAEPRIISERAGRLGPFVVQPPRTLIELRAERHAQSGRAVHGSLWVRVDGVISGLSPGDRVRITGIARGLSPPTNPGEPDARWSARARGFVGSMDVDSVAGVERLGGPSGVRAHTERLAGRLRAGASRWLEEPASTPAVNETDHRDAEARALLRALLLGQSDREAGELRDAFTRLGVAHILSISGLNLTLLAGTILVIFKVAGDRPRVEAVVAAAIIGAYLLVIPVRAPVLRAAIMVWVFLAAEATGRRYDRVTILSWAAVLTLLWRPAELFSPGFQLSFLVVWGLLVLAPRVRSRWMGPRPSRDTHGPIRALFETVKDASAASMVAWVISAPLVAHHVGVFSPFGALATLALMPVVGLIMSGGYIAIVIAMVAPDAAVFIEPALTALARVLGAIVFSLDAAPASALYTPRLSAAWTIVATAALTWCMLPRRDEFGLLVEGETIVGRARRWWMDGLHIHPTDSITRSSNSAARAEPQWVRRAERWSRAGLAVIAVAWCLAAWNAPLLRAGDLARLDTLDVGDGTCHLLRLRDERTGQVRVLLWDAGSLRLTIGERTIPQSVRALGVRRVPSVVISHPNLDHYAGLLDVIEPLGVERVILSRAFELAAQDDPLGPEAFVRAALVRRGVELRIVEPGDTTLPIPGLATELLSPPAAETVGRGWNANDLSLVARFSSGASSILLCGDVQRAAIASILERRPDLRASVMELPHHGSWNDPSRDLVERVGARVVVQSTGPSRLNDRRWDDVKLGRTWMITARDGASSVWINKAGEPRVAAWREEPLAPPPPPLPHPEAR